MPVQHEDFLTTGAAVPLGSSRQHVVDLCDVRRARLHQAGNNRRVRRADIEAMLLHPGLPRDQFKALWLHRAVTGRPVADPEGVLSKARSNLARLRGVHRDGTAKL
jgi:hypothetical protein